MALPPRLFPGNEELGKKYDDHKVKARGHMNLPWWPRKLFYGQRWHTKRAILGILVILCLYYFFKNMPTDLENPRPRPSYSTPSGQWTSASRSRETSSPSRPKAKDQLQADEEEVKSPYYFNGPITFYELADSLHAVSRTQTADLIDRNVVFAAASLKSASILLPIACEMGIKQKNIVHFALMGRDDISMDLLRSMNGIDDSCKIIFHDARPDYSVHSTDFRMETSVAAAYSHLLRFLHPQATLIDGSGVEESFFAKALIRRAKSFSKTVIELPSGAEQSLMWLTWLDGTSLSAWNDVTIDILVHAPKSSSGSLVRLLDSLKNADFFSTTPPRLTIELPHKVDGPTTRYLEHFKWPSQASQTAGSTLTLHHRIPRSGLTPEENDIRFLEAFWPANPPKSHILVLSPQTELSSFFYHYLKYTVLHYKYSSKSQTLYKDLLGISLELPSTYLNDSTIFTPPPAIVASVGTDAESNASPFLWQAPNSNAGLYFGDIWVELHDFAAHLLSSQHANPSSTGLKAKLVSKTHPSWLEHILKLARARGYKMIYPGFEGGASVVTLHHDLYQPPEEYTEDLEKMEEPVNDKILTGDLARHKYLEDKTPSLSSRSLLSILPFKGELPNLDEMPLLSWDGVSVDSDAMRRESANYSRIIRQDFGKKCDASSPEKLRADMAAGDLFCFENDNT